MSASSNNNSPASATSNTPSDTHMSCETAALVLSLGLRPLLLRSADTACMKKKADMMMMLLMMMVMMLLMMIMMIKI